MTATPTLAVEVLRAPRARRANTTFLVSVGVLAVMTLAAILAPVIAPYPPDQVDLSSVHAAPSAAHWLGTDALGRDLLSRLIFGARTALLGPLLVVVISTVLGILLGLLAGWRGGWLDAGHSFVTCPSWKLWGRPPSSAPTRRAPSPPAR